MTALMKHLKDAGRLKLLPGILRSLRAEQQQSESRSAVLEVASEQEKAGAIREAKAMGIDAQTVRINPDLISGWRVRHDSVLIDHSAKRSLIDLYRRITS